MLSWQAIADPLKGQPNGIDSRTICALTRYAGISDRISFVGFYELPSTPMTDSTFAQMIWYFIEGVHCDLMNIRYIKDFLKYSSPFQIK